VSYKYLFDELEKNIEHKKVLHVGCVGSWDKDSTNNFGMHKYLMEHVKELHGIDIDGDGINKMKEDGYKNVFIDNNELDDKYDVIAPLSVLHFVPNPIEFLSYYKDKLNDNGAIVAEVGNAYSFSNIYRTIFKFNLAKPTTNIGQSEIGEVFIFSSSTVIKLFNASGFNDVKVVPVYRKKVAKGNIKEQIRISINNLMGYIIRGFSPTIFIVAKVN
jgi:hypothetical protein